MLQVQIHQMTRTLDIATVTELFFWLQLFHNYCLSEENLYTILELLYTLVIISEPVDL